MAKGNKSKSNGKGRTLEDGKAFNTKVLNQRNIGIIVIGLLVGYLHQCHVSSLLESDRHFSHLSTLEREMSFRTEMGLYYSYFKTVVEAPSFLSGVDALYNNDLTEFPDTINTLQRFNLYPEIILGGSFRLFEKVSSLMNWKTKECWRVNRGENLSPVWSCEGIGDPAYFYLNGVWICAAFTMTCTFLLATQLSESLVGGVLAVVCYFYNHGECTRVQWTPPLRESFAYPLAVAQMYLVTIILRRNASKGNHWQLFGLAILTTFYMAFWQFAQFALFTQVCCLIPIFSLGLIKSGTFEVIIKGQMMGLLFGLVLLFGNKMLLTSWFCCSLVSSLVLLKVLSVIEGKLSKGSPSESEKVESSNFRQFCFIVSLAIAKTVVFLVMAVGFKIAAGKILDVKDDDHIVNLLRSKFSDYRDFHTLLYTCAKEFDFLGLEMPIKATQTLLIPSVIIVLVAVITNTFQKFSQSSSTVEEIPDSMTFFDAALVYNVCQLIAYAFMAIIIMRLKLFFVPQLCIIAALLGNKNLLPVIRNNANIHLALVFGVLACMSVQGISNINHQRSIIGEYSNVEFEELIEWINSTTPQESSFAGPMPVMANVLLSTRRPVINHPHYEDVGIRTRTFKIYQMYSRRTPEEYYRTLQELKANFLVISKGWCFATHTESECGMTDMWDIEEPERRHKLQPLCPKLFEGQASAIRPFQKVFQNVEYVVLRLPDTFVELKSSKVSS